MTMKRFLLLGAAMAATFMSVGNVQAQSKKTADQLRVYINPGHGSWGPNDRPCATIPYPALETGRWASTRQTPTSGSVSNWVAPLNVWA